MPILQAQVFIEGACLNPWARVELCHRNPDTLKRTRHNNKPIAWSNSAVGNCAPQQTKNSQNKGKLQPLKKNIPP